MTSVLGLSMPKIGIQKDDLTSPKTLAIGGIAATSVVGGGVIGALRGSPLKGLAVGGAIAAVALGASLIGNASASYDNGYYDSYHGGYPRGYDPYPGGYDPGYRDRDYDGAREDYPSGGEYYPGGGTSPGDDY